MRNSEKPKELGVNVSFDIYGKYYADSFGEISLKRVKQNLTSDLIIRKWKTFKKL